MPLAALRHVTGIFAAAILFSALMGGAATGAAAQEKVVLQLRWDHQFQFAGYYAALWQGYYAAAGIDVDIRPGVMPDRKQLNAIDEVTSGRADFGIAAADLVVAHAEGRPVTIVASIFQQSPVSIIVRKESGISSPADLIDRRVRRITGDLADVEYQTMMRAEGFDPDRVSTLFAPPTGRGVDLLKKGEVDAYAGFYYSELWRARGAGVAIAQIKPANYGVDFYGDTLFTSTGLRERNPALVERFRQASIQGWNYALEHSEEIADRIAAELPRTFKIRERQEFERFLAAHVARLTLYPIVDVGHTNPDRWQHIYRALRQAKLVGDRYDAAAFIYDPVAEEIRRDVAMFHQAVYAGVAAAILLVLVAAWSWTLRREVRRRTRDLAESEERYELAVNGVNEGIWDRNLLTDEDYLSPRWKALLGFRDDEMENVAPSFYERVHPEDRLRLEGALDAHLRGDAPYSIEVRLLHKDGGYRWFLARGAAQRDATGRPVRMVGSIADISERKEAERALYESQHLLSKILETTGQGFWFVDTDTVTINVNPAMCEILRRSREDILGKDIYAFVDVENAAIFSQEIEKRRRGIDEPYEVALRRPDGTSVSCINTPSPLFSQDGKRTGTVGIWTDITERKEAERELRRERDFANSLVNTAPAIVLLLDPRGYIQYVNPYFERLTGYRLDEIHGKEWFSTFLPERDRDHIRAMFHGAVEDAPTSGNVNAIVTRSGEERQIEWTDAAMRDEHGNIRSLLAIGADVTDRVAQEAALRWSQTLLTEAERTARLGSWELDLPTGELRWSDEIYRIFEIDRDQLVASYEAFLAAIHPDDRDAVNNAYTESVASREPYQIAHRLRMPDGRIKWVEERCGTTYDDAGQPIRSTGTVQDVSARVAVEEELRRSLAEKETLLREIHHRVKNNLQIISSLLYFQAQKIESPGALDIINDGRDRLRAMMLVHEKLYMSKDLSQVDFGGYVRTLVQQLADSHAPRDGRIAVKVEAGERSLPIELATPCGLLVCELVTNALKHAFPDGRAGEVTVRIVGDEDDDLMKVTVADDGIGLPEGFDPKAGGSFGWQLIEGLLSQVNGDLAVTRDTGTMVTVSIPFSAAAQ